MVAAALEDGEDEGVARVVSADRATGGKPTAVVALARKLAGIMLAVWRDGTEFDQLLLRSDGRAAVT